MGRRPAPSVAVRRGSLRNPFLLRPVNAPPAPLPRAFFERPTLEVAHELLGARLSRIEPAGRRLGGIVTETEAYIGQEDLACHGRHGLTERNRPMWGRAGFSYVYFTYGMHWLLNVVTEAEGFPAAVLLRALVPDEGVELMRQRRQRRTDHRLCDGPAKLCQALAIDGDLSGIDLCRQDSPLRLSGAMAIPEGIVTKGPRVGLNNVPEPWRSKPWRFRVHPSDLEKLKETGHHHDTA